MLAVPELAVVALSICFIVEKAFKIHLNAQQDFAVFGRKDRGTFSPSASWFFIFGYLSLLRQKLLKG